MSEQLTPLAIAPPEAYAPPIQEVGFEQFSHDKRELPDPIVLDLMNNSLRSSPDEKGGRFVKSYLDQLQTDESDNSFINNPEELKASRNQLSDFVSGHLRLRTTDKLNPRQQQLVSTKLEDFKQKIESDKGRVDDYIDGIYRGERKDLPRDALNFHGLNITKGDTTVDLLKSKLPGVRSNMVMQREATGLFVHYSTEGYLEKAEAGNKPELTRRIYLNPKVESSVEIFQAVVESAEAAGITMKGKVFDRTLEAINRLATSESERTMRGDGIVLYAGEDADALLGLVEAVYKDNPAAFEGRRVSRIPMRIAEGVAIGDEPVTKPGEEAESLTSQRATILEVASATTKQRLGLSPSANIPAGQEQQALATYRQVYGELALQAGVNPENIAFNLPQAA